LRNTETELCFSYTVIKHSKTVEPESSRIKTLNVQFSFSLNDMSISTKTLYASSHGLHIRKKS